MFSVRTFFLTLLALIGLSSVFSSSAHAAGLSDAAGETFGNSEVVGDEELSKMRGGFINVNGLLIGFNFYSNVQVGLDTMQNISVNTESLAQAALTASQIQDLLQPQIIQNMDDNLLISIQQSLSVDIVNAALLNQAAQLDQLQYQQALN